MFAGGLHDAFLDLYQVSLSRRQVDFLFLHGRADVAGDVEVVTFFGDALHRDALGIAVFFAALAVGLDNFVDVLVRENVLALAFLEVLGGVDEEDVIGLLASLEDEDADGNAGGVEEICGQTDDGVDMSVLEQLGANLFLGSAAEEDAMADGRLTIRRR